MSKLLLTIGPPRMNDKSLKARHLTSSCTGNRTEAHLVRSFANRTVAEQYFHRTPLHVPADLLYTADPRRDAITLSALYLGLRSGVGILLRQSQHPKIFKFTGNYCLGLLPLSWHWCTGALAADFERRGEAYSSLKEYHMASMLFGSRSCSPSQFHSVTSCAPQA